MRRGVRVHGRTKLAAVAGCLALTASFAAIGCGGTDEGDEAAQGGEINVTLTSFPDYLDPQLSYTLEGWEALWPSYTPLLTYKHEAGEPGTEVVPGLAEDLPEISSDGKTYTLTLRDGMKYSDGTPIKASDFKYAVERMFDVESGGSSFYTTIVGAEDYQAGKAKDISGIKTNDQTGEITIELTEPRGTFNNELGLMFTAPIPQNTPAEDQTKNPPPSSGPFMITDVQPGRTFVMERNPEFKTIQDAGADEVADAHVDKITVTENKSNTAQVTDIEQNKVDFMVDPPSTDRLPEVESKYSDRFRFEDSINTYYMFLNYQDPPFDDLKVRQAVNWAIDPDALARIFGGRLHPTQQILPPGMPGYEEYELFPGRPDLDKARELLKEANPSDTDITVWTNDEPDRKRIGAYYQDVLNDIGFNAELKVISGEIYFTTIGNQKTANLDTGFDDWFQDYPHPNDFFQPLLSGESILPTNNQNHGNVDIPELNKEISRLAQEQLTPEVEAQYADLDRKFMEQAVWAPYGNERFTTFLSERMDFDESYHHLLFNQDYTSFAITD
jgi:peptide/nickel transport system substrate-binding protein